MLAPSLWRMGEQGSPKGAGHRKVSFWHNTNI